MVNLGNEQRSFCCFWDCIQVLHFGLFCWPWWLNETKPFHVGPPKRDGSWWRGLTECGPLEKGMANHFSSLALRTPWTVWKGKMIGYWKVLPRSVGVQYATRDQWRNNSRKNEGAKVKTYPVVDVTGDGSKIQRCKEQYCIGTWNVRSMLLSHFSRVRLCATPEMAAHQAPQSLGFSRKEHWSGLPFSSMHESEKWK